MFSFSFYRVERKRFVDLPCSKQTIEKHYIYKAAFLIGACGFCYSSKFISSIVIKYRYTFSTLPLLSVAGSTVSEKWTIPIYWL